MKILIASPVSANSTRGNRISAIRWTDMLRELGHQVVLKEEGEMGGQSVSSADHRSETTSVDGQEEGFDEQEFDCLIALHARRSALSVEWFHERFPAGCIVVCLTGTDLHGDLQPSTDDNQSQSQMRHQIAVRSLELADRLVLLEPEGLKRIPQKHRAKCQVIFQSAEQSDDRGEPPADHFLVSVIGHLRPIKDPFRVAEAVRSLPETSKISVIQIGDALSAEMKEQAIREQADNPRYHWIGSVSHQEALRVLTQSHLTVLSSFAEGGPSVLSEAIVNHIPVLSSRIDASLGILGSGYQGFFDAGATQELARLLIRAESDSGFLGQLRTEVKSRAGFFKRSAEKAAWSQLLDSLELN